MPDKMHLMALNAESSDAKKLHEQRAFSYQLVEAYNQKFIDPSTGKHWADSVMERNCPVCDANNPIYIFDKRGASYVKCPECTMVYTNPCGKEETLKKYYEGSITQTGTITKNEADFSRAIYTEGLTMIESIKKGGTILDIGCSVGFFLDIAKERGWQTFGVEPNKVESAECITKGHTMYTDTLANVSFDRTFDVITLWDVYEHFPDGHRYLELLKNLLAPQGIIFMQIPNADALAARIMRDQCRMFDGLEHCNLYNPKTIAQIAQMHGCSIGAIKSVISEIAVMNNFLDYEDPYFGNTQHDNKAGLLGFLNEQTIHDQLLGYKLQLLLQKKAA